MRSLSNIALIALLMLVVSACTDESSAMEDVGALPTIEDLAGAGEITSTVDEVAEPEGGYESLYKYIQDNMVYPDVARKNGLEGKVFINFVISKEGKMIAADVAKGISGECDKEALRVVSNYDAAWKPAEFEGKKVNMKMTLPISFVLN